MRAQDVAMMQAQMEQASKQNEQAINAIQQMHAAEMQALQQDAQERMQALVAKRDTLNDIVDRLQHQLAQQRDTIEELEEERNELHEQVVAFEEENAALRAQVATLTEQQQAQGVRDVDVIDLTMDED